MNNYFSKYLVSFLLLILSQQITAAAYTLYNKQESVVGEITSTYSTEEDTLLDIARLNGLGYQDIKLVNPGVDTWIPGEGVEIQLPSQFILPAGNRKGLVLNIPEMRLYYFYKNEQGEQEVETFPLGVGREGWSTPYIKTKIIEKKENPNWYPPKSILKEHEEAGDPLPEIVESGPDNPLGAFAMRLGRPEYLIHGTNKPFGIGMRVSHGCIRLYPEDIEYLFSQVKVGTKVEIVNQPFKVGQKNGVLYLEAHPYLEEDVKIYHNNLTPIINLIISATEENEYDIDWDRVRYVTRNPTGVPLAIGMHKVEKQNTQLATMAMEKGLSGVEKAIQTVHEPSVPNVVTEATTIDIAVTDIAAGDITARAIQSQENKLRLQLDMKLSP